MSKKSTKNEPESKKTEPGPEETPEILFDDKWSCDIIFLVECDVPSNNFINLLQQIKQIQPGIKSITKTEIMKEVKKKGASKKGSGKSQKKGKVDTPVELTDEQKIMKAVKESTPLPSKPLANVIKRYLINIKLNDVNERQKLYSEFLQMSKKKVKSPPSKKKQDKLSDEDKQEEEIFIEKPPLFIILSGFHEHDLPLELLKVDVSIRAIVKLQEPSEMTINDEVQQTKTSDGLESEKFNMTWLKFWYLYENLMAIPVNAEYEVDVALVKRHFPAKVNDPAVNAKEKKLLVQDEIISLANYIQTLLKQHKDYLNNTNFYAVPEQIASIEDASVYKTLTQMVPLECSSIPFILFCLLEQVCFWNGEEINIEDKNKLDHKCRLSFSFTQPCTPVIIANNDANLLKTFHLNIPEINLRMITKNLLSTIPLLNQFKVYPKKNQMEKHFYEYHLQRLWKHVENKKVGLFLFDIYLHWYILCKIRTYYDKEKSCINNRNSLSTLGNELIDKWINELVTHSLFKVLNDEDESAFNEKSDLGRKSVLLSIYQDCEIDVDADNEEDKKNKLELKQVKKIKIARKENLKLLRNFLYCFELLCLQENKNSRNISNFFKSHIDFQYIEEMSSESLLQVLQDSVIKYCRVKNFHYPPTNKILVWLHNDTCTIFEEHFSIEINTLLGFRDFCNEMVFTHEFHDQEKLKSEGIQSERESEKSNQSDQTQTNQFNLKPSSSREKVERKQLDNLSFNLGKTKIKLNRNIKKFFSEDGTYVIVEIDDWYKTSKVLKISIFKIDTELKFYKNMVNDTIAEDGNENVTAVLNLPNDIFLNIPITERNIYSVDENGNVQQMERNFIYNYFTITLPTGLIIEIIKDELDKETYVKQSFVNKGPDCNKIWDEKCRFFLKSGTLILFKNDDTIDIIYSNSVKSRIKNIETFEEETPTEQEKHDTENIVTEPLKENKEKKSKTAPKNKKNQEAKSETPEINEEVKIKKSVHKISEHTVTSWSGITYEFKDGELVNTIDSNANLRTVFSPYKELYIDRNDGVKSLLIDNGQLVSMHSDGTKLTTYFYEEEREVGLSDDKLNEKLTSSLDYGRFDSFNYRPSLRVMRDSNFHSDMQESVLNFKSEESKFVSIKLGSVMEHPNFATVEFHPEYDSIKLTLPGDLLVEVNENSEKTSFNIEVTIGNKAKVFFNNDCIEFLSNIYKKSNVLNVSVLKPNAEAGSSEQHSEYFCETLGSLGYLFLVNNKGEVKLINTKIDSESLSKDLLQRTSLSNLEGFESYFDNYIPRRMFNRYFVVNENYSGYEMINKLDLTYLDEKDELKYNNVSVIRNPTNGRIDSIVRQYLIHKTHSENYLLPYESGGFLTIPMTLQRLDLGPVWTPMQSPWFLIRSDKVKRYYKRFSYSDISTHTDERIIAVVIKTIQKVFDDDEELHCVPIISNCLKNYSSENEEIYKKYKSQSFSDFEIDSRLRETQDLICKIKNDFPQWNVIKNDCDVCKQKFGQLKKTDEEYVTPDDISEN